MVKIFNENCFDTMQRKEYLGSVDVILTSPPYNTGRTSTTHRSFENRETRYDVYLDDKTEEQYIDWSINLFLSYNEVLKQNGVVLYNISYGNEQPNTLWLVMAEIIKNTPFMIADCICWKKKSALPNNVSPNKLTRITEFVFVLCRKNEYETFVTNKKVKSVSENGQNFYENVFNFIEAKNNDGVCPYNQATYSVELCEKLLLIYAKKGSLVYDSFMGSGTTALACKRLGLDCIGSELSSKQCEWANNRLNKDGNQVTFWNL